jgi:hypothetical protein
MQLAHFKHRRGRMLDSEPGIATQIASIFAYNILLWLVQVARVEAKGSARFEYDSLFPHATRL